MTLTSLFLYVFVAIIVCFSYFHIANLAYDNLNKKKSQRYLEIINKIENVRKKNNSNWMGILKIAFKYSPKETAKIMKNIYREDKTISSLAKKLTK